MFKQISDTLPSFEAYEKLFASHAYIRYSLSLAYLDVLRFCIAAKDIFVGVRKSGQKPSKLATFKVTSKYALPKLLWSNFESQFGSIIEDFRRHKSYVDEQAKISHMLEEAQEREAQSQERQLQQAERDAQSNERHLQEAERAIVANKRAQEEARHRRKLQTSHDFKFANLKEDEWVMARMS